MARFGGPFSFPSWKRSPHCGCARLDNRARPLTGLYSPDPNDSGLLGETRVAGAPIGNQNAANGKKWRAAIDRALEAKSRAEGKEALDEIAKVLINQALEGEQWAIDMIGNRLDGKPAQAVAISGDENSPLVHKVIREIVRPKASNG